MGQLLQRVGAHPPESQQGLRQACLQTTGLPLAALGQQGTKVRGSQMERSQDQPEEEQQQYEHTTDGQGPGRRGIKREKYR